jgi:hypothetical protein
MRKFQVHAALQAAGFLESTSDKTAPLTSECIDLESTMSDFILTKNLDSREAGTYDESAVLHTARVLLQTNGLDWLYLPLNARVPPTLTHIPFNNSYRCIHMNGW